jgi:hypothetical protein
MHPPTTDCACPVVLDGHADMIEKASAQLAAGTITRPTANSTSDRHAYDGMEGPHHQLRDRGETASGQGGRPR